MSEQPSVRLLTGLAKALKVAKYPNVAGHLLAGLLWAIYPDWYDKNLRKRRVEREHQ